MTRSNFTLKFTLAILLAMVLSFMLGWGNPVLAQENTKPIEAKALTSHGCNDSEWHFVINQVSDESLAPAFIVVTWANGNTEVVGLSKFSGQVAHYATSSNLNSTVVSATADIYEGWDGQFNLSHGPCGTSTETPASSPTVTATFTATQTETPTETLTATPTETATSTSTVTATNTATPTSTGTVTATFTSTVTATGTLPTNTATVTATSTATSTGTATTGTPVTSTSTFTSTPNGGTQTPSGSATATPRGHSTGANESNLLMYFGVALFAIGLIALSTRGLFATVENR